MSAAGVTVNLPCDGNSGNVDVPKVNLPNVNLPNVNLPNVNLPNVNLPSLGLNIGRKMLQVGPTKLTFLVSVYFSGINISDAHLRRCYSLQTVHHLTSCAQ